MKASTALCSSTK